MLGAEQSRDDLEEGGGEDPSLPGAGASRQDEHSPEFEEAKQLIMTAGERPLTGAEQSRLDDILANTFESREALANMMRRMQGGAHLGSDPEETESA